MDGTAINDGLQPIDAATPFLAGNVQFLPADASVQAPPAHPIPPLIPQQIVGPALMSLSSFSRQTRPENIWCLLPLSHSLMPVYRKAKLMVNKILNHPGIVDQDFFLIRIQFVKVRWWIRANAKGTLEKPEPKVVTTLAQGLTSPEDGNVEFQAISADGSVKSLFAHRSVLTFKSDVFKQGDHPPCPPKSTLLNPEEFESGFKEGIDPVVVLPNQCPRRVIHSTLKYEPLHVLLYYLYSGNVLFTTSVTIDDHLDMPIADAEAIFAGAHFYDISSLKGKAAAFLAGTCNEHNIVSRFFGDYALIYDELFEAYSRPFCRYWGQLKDTDEFDNTFEVRDTKEMTREELVRQVMYLDKVNRRFREFAKGFSMDCGTDSYYPMRAATPQQHYAMHQY